MRKLAYFPRALSSDEIAQVYGFGAAARPCRRSAPPCQNFPRDDSDGAYPCQNYPEPKSQQGGRRNFGYY